MSVMLKDVATVQLRNFDSRTVDFKFERTDNGTHTDFVLHPNREILGELLREFCETRKMIRELKKKLRDTPRKFKYSRIWIEKDIQELETMLVDIQDDMDYYTVVY